MIPYATKNQLNNLETKLEQKITPPNTCNDIDVGYVHKLSFTDVLDEETFLTQYLYVRLDTAEIAPSYDENSTEAEHKATVEFIFEHLIGLVRCEETDDFEPTATAVGPVRAIGRTDYYSGNELMFLGTSLTWHGAVRFSDITNEGE